MSEAVSRDDAVKLVVDRLNPDEMLAEFDDKYAVDLSKAFETRLSWVFYCDSRRFIETGNSRFSVIGGPGYAVIDKRDGKVRFTGPLLDTRPITGALYLEYQKYPAPHRLVKYFVHSLWDLFRFMMVRFV
ncbi:MAG: YrhB domain-containing protein [Chloroflexota bacterium]